MGDVLVKLTVPGYPYETVEIDDRVLPVGEPVTVSEEERDRLKEMPRVRVSDATEKDKQEVAEAGDGDTASDTPDAGGGDAPVPEGKGGKAADTAKGKGQ
jgi:hypothetical protein